MMCHNGLHDLTLPGAILPWVARDQCSACKRISRARYESSTKGILRKERGYQRQRGGT